MKKLCKITSVVLTISVIFCMILSLTSCKKNTETLNESSEVSISEINTSEENESSSSEHTSSNISSEEITEDKGESSSSTINTQSENEDSSSMSSSKNNVSSDASKESSTSSNKTANETGITTFEEGKKQTEQKAQQYMKEHQINPDTAGETGEICHCGKKIWNPDKYGFCIPGYPDDYENSGYCTGACSIQLN